MPKRCSRCETVYDDPAAAFSRDKFTRDGLRYTCKRCVKIYLREYHQRPEVRRRHIAYCRAYRLKHGEHLRQAERDKNAARKLKYLRDKLAKL